MKVSIVTTSFNRAGSIASCIESVLSQDYADIEYVLVDGASTDGTMDIVRGYADRISSVTSEPDHGMYEGLNKGIRKATGDIIGLLHSDDMFYSPETISHIANEMERTGADMMYGDGLFVKAADTDCVVRDWISGEYTKSKVARGWLPLHTTCFVRREVFEKVGYYNEGYRISADTDWLIRCLYEADLKVAYLHEYVVKMRMGGASTSFRQMKKKWSEDLSIYRKHNLGRFIPFTLKVASKVPQFAKAIVKRALGKGRQK